MLFRSGAGPAGLEAALTLARRGLTVSLAEKSRHLGGRIAAESSLPGLSSWGRVRDWRVTMLAKQPRVQIFPESEMSPADILEFGADHVVIATGSRWRRDGLGLGNLTPCTFAEALTPDDLFAGTTVSGPVVILEDEQYFMAGAWAEKLALAGHEVTLVTPWATPATFAIATNEQDFVLDRLARLGVRILPFTHVTGQTVGLGQSSGLGQSPGLAHLQCVYTARPHDIACGTLVLCTGRLVQDDLYSALTGQIPNLARVGDCLQPSSIADAVYSAHRFARLLGQDDPPPRREIPALR